MKCFTEVEITSHKSSVLKIVRERSSMFLFVVEQPERFPLHRECFPKGRSSLSILRATTVLLLF